MSLLTLPFRLPLLPVQGVIRLAEILRDEAERQYHDPVPVREELEEAEQAAASGQMSDEALAEREEQIIGRLAPQQAPADRSSASGREG